MKIEKNYQVKDFECFTPHQLLQSITSMTGHLGVKSEQILSDKQQDALKVMDEIVNQAENQSLPIDKKPKKLHGLKQLIKQQKIKCLVRNFANKIKRNNIRSQPTQYSPFFEQQKTWMEKQGINLPDSIESLWALVSGLQVVVLIIFYSLSLVFEDILDKQSGNEVGQKVQMVSIAFYVLEIVASLITVRSVEGRKLTTIQQISLNYLRGRFFSDFINLVVLVLDVSTNQRIVTYFRLVILLKIGQVMDNIQKLENYLIDTLYKQQYWGLIKIFLSNFCVAHFIAIILIFISRIDNQHNWIKNKGLVFAPWYEVYSWSYYWANTIMLTVGFGDIAASNFKQAMCVTLIQTFSCIILAYNINCVGNLLSSIRAQDIEKNRNYKIFNKLAKKNDLPDDLTHRVNNYIEQSTNIKKKFNFEEENKFISNLPYALKADYLKQSNKKIFQSLIFFRNLTQKTLLDFAQKIQTRICHPEEYITLKDDQFNVLILKKGNIAYCCRKQGCDFNDTIIDQIRIKQKDQAFLLSLNFISKYKPSYEMKSLHYSLIYYLNYSTLIAILQNGQLDYQHYCQLRDKSRHIVDEYQVFTCDLCKSFHTKFDCPKLHYIPFPQHIILKYLHNIKSNHFTRLSFQRKKKYFPILRNAKSNKKPATTNQLQKAKTIGSIKQQGTNKSFISLSKASIQDLATDNNLTLKSDPLQIQIKQTAVLIADEISKHLNKGKSYQFWQCEVDQIKNYKFYFTQNNSNRLKASLSKK